MINESIKEQSFKHLQNSFSAIKLLKSRYETQQFDASCPLCNVTPKNDCTGCPWHFIEGSGCYSGIEERYRFSSPASLQTYKKIPGVEAKRQEAIKARIKDLNRWIKLILEELSRRLNVGDKVIVYRGSYGASYTTIVHTTPYQIVTEDGLRFWKLTGFLVKSRGCRTHTYFEGLDRKDD